jgi:hypothetical protein
VPRSGAGLGSRARAPPDLLSLWALLLMVLCFFFLFPCLLQKKEGEGGDAVTGHIISTTIGGKNGEPKRVSHASLAVCLPVCRADVCVNAAAVSGWSGSACFVAAFAVGIRLDLMVCAWVRVLCLLFSC